jgi:phage tail sheath protein FI
MPFNYKSPGVYVEEVDKGARPIEAAGTSVLAMIGLVRESINVEKPGQGLLAQPTPNSPTPTATSTSPSTAATCTSPCTAIF